MDSGEANVNTTNEKSSTGLISAGYICAFLALLIVPPFLGLAGLIIGIVNLTKGNTGHGITQIILSAVCAIIGMQIGAAVSTALF